MTKKAKLALSIYEMLTKVRGRRFIFIDGQLIMLPRWTTDNTERALRGLHK